MSFVARHKRYFANPPTRLARMAAPSQRRALGALFLLLALGFAGIAVAAIAAGAGARSWVVGGAAAAIALWLAGLALRALRRSSS